MVMEREQFLKGDERAQVLELKIVVLLEDSRPENTHFFQNEGPKLSEICVIMVTLIERLVQNIDLYRHICLET